MKKMYISPAIMVRGIENGAFLENPIENYSYSDIDPESDPETDQPVRAWVKLSSSSRTGDS